MLMKIFGFQDLENMMIFEEIRYFPMIIFYDNEKGLENNS